MSINRSGVDVGSLRRSLASATVCAIAAFLTVPAVHATSGITADYCASIHTGQIHPIASGTCPAGERSLGVGKLLPQATRPHQLDPQLVARFNAARTVGASHGYTISIRSGWRSVNHQQHLFDAAVTKYGSVATAAKWVLPPRDSMHTFGLAIDVTYSGKIQGASFWFQKYSAHFGLCRRYRNEWWHFEPLVSPGQPCPTLEMTAATGLPK
jgi:zinc D-Ala-D-Ala carboxypeptidase